MSTLRPSTTRFALRSATVLLERRLPGAIIADEGIEDGCELSHGGDKSDLGRFPVVAQALVEETEGVIMADGAECRHVEGTAHRGAAAGDMALAAELSAIVIDRRDADQGGELLMLDAAEFRELGEEHGGRCRADAIDAGHDGLSVGQGSIGFDGSGDRGIDLRELVAQHSNMLVDPGGDGGGGMLEMIALGDQSLDEVAPARDQARQSRARRIDRRQGRGTHRLAEARQDTGIDRVRLGEPALGPGKIACLTRIDDGTYGYCEETGEPISLRRLEARPIATLSIEAQERHERRERVYRDE